MPIHVSAEEKIKIDAEVQKYARHSIVECAEHSEDEFVSQIFPVPKKSGGVRIILNLKPLNEDLHYQHFKMESLKSVLDLIERNCYMASIDLKDAYYSMSIHPNDRKYLRFIWNGTLFQFTCLPNGLSSAPRWFTKLLKPIFSQLRSSGFVSVYYLDDTWLMGRSIEECNLNVSNTLEMLQKAGFLVNEEKSRMSASQMISFLGFDINSKTMTVSLPADKRFEILSLCNILLKGNSFKIRFVARVIGKLVSCLPAVQFGALFYRYLETDKIKSLKLSAGDYDSYMTLTEDSKSELKWWIDNALNCSRPIDLPDYSCTLTTDASKLGWGAVYDGEKTGGRWSAIEAECHINELELLAIFYGLKSFSSHISGSHVRVQSDNTTAVTYINNLGGVKSVGCHEIAKKIWLWALQNRVILSAEHLPGSVNVLADKASRVFDDNTEWSLVPCVFDNIRESLGPFSIDLFASRLNCKHSIYASWKPDPSAAFVDAFSRNWTKYSDFYAFPPFSVILRCLRKIDLENAQGTLIVPLWPAQPWFPKLLKMIVAPPTILPKNCLCLPFSKSDVPNFQKNLHLLVCPVSGNALRVEAFQMSLSQYYARPGGVPPLNTMKSIIGNGILTVASGKLIPCNLMKPMSSNF